MTTQDWRAALDVLKGVGNGDGPAYPYQIDGLSMTIYHDSSFSCVRDSQDPDYRGVVTFSPRDTAAVYAFLRQIAFAEILELAARNAVEP